MSFGKNLRILRKRNRLSQIDLAAIIGITERTIYNYETGQKVPKQSTLVQLADVLGVTPELLLNGDPDKDFKTREEYDVAKKKLVQMDQELLSHAKNSTSQAIDAVTLLEQTTALFTGGTLSEEAKDEFFESITQAYFLAKRKAKLRNVE